MENIKRPVGSLNRISDWIPGTGTKDCPVHIDNLGRWLIMMQPCRIFNTMHYRANRVKKIFLNKLR